MKTQHYNNFWQCIHNSAKDRGFPLRVMFELTYRCNFDCKHCYVPLNYRRKSSELKTKEVFFILEQLRDIGCFYLGFTGGEPFLRKDIMDILRYTKKCGFQIIIYTNGSLIDEKIADELANLRLNKVDITIPAMSKVAFERISGLADSQNRVFAAIKLLHKNGVNLGFKTCVLKENENEIKDIQKFAASLGALHRLDDMLSARLDGSREPFKYRGRLRNNPIISQRSEVTGRKINNYDLENCDGKTIDHRPCLPAGRASAFELFKCGVGVSQAAITPQGELKMCLMIDYPKYKILESSLRDCWQRLKRLVKNIKPDEDYHCNKCELAPFCKGCPAKSWLYNRTFTSCEAEVKTFAEANKKLSEGIQLVATEVKA